MELSENQQAFKDLGYEVAVMTYEPPEITRKFTDEWQISYPVLFDEKAMHVTAFDVLNTDYPPGHSAYGIPHPGVFLTNSSGRILAKFYRTAYQERPPWDVIHHTLAAIKPAPSP